MRIFSLNNFKDRRRELRKKSTPEESMLWAKLRSNQLGVKFRRQHSIGRYIADFYCPYKKLVIELDGKQHLDAREYDRERDRYFKSLGIDVIRFTNTEIRESIGSVIEQISENLT